MQRFFTLLCCLFFLFINANAQQTFPVNGPTDPRHITYAITNVRLYVDYKTVVDPATILIRDGLILEAGAGVTVPSDAVVYDYKGKTIYPSLIELVSDYGQPELKRPQGNFEDPQLLTNTKGAYDWNQAVKAEVDAYRSFVADTKKAEEWRKLGFGTVLSTQRDGVVRGTAACVLLGDGEEHELILRDRAAAAYSFDKGISTQDYPSSLMGSIALLRQTWYDARWYKEGGNKKEYNITLESFNRNLELPQWFEAGDKQNELRVARIGKEFGVNFLIKGSGDEYERAAELKAAGCRLIVPVAFPDAYDLSDPYDALGISLHQLRHWELAPGNAATLAQQGIEFALTSSDLKNRGDFWKNIRKAIAR
ncbi:MAG: amidohydrolase, partial [Bacteroidia bacterium]|nr:amidohydrolase [Bacteroidia bacterium]